MSSRTLVESYTEKGDRLREKMRSKVANGTTSGRRRRSSEAPSSRKNSRAAGELSTPQTEVFQLHRRFILFGMAVLLCRAAGGDPSSWWRAHAWQATPVRRSARRTQLFPRGQSSFATRSSTSPSQQTTRLWQAVGEQEGSSISPAATTRKASPKVKGATKKGATKRVSKKAKKNSYPHPASRKRSAPSSSKSSSQNLANSKRLNQKLVACTTAAEILQVLQSQPGALTQTAGGGVLNSVNFSTALHRLARHSVGQAATRAAVLGDARFALLVAAVAEAMAASGQGHHQQGQKVRFFSREVSNIGWALAKLKLPPPLHVMKMNTKNDKTVDDSSMLLQTARKVRQAVMEAAAARREQGKPVDSSTWIPALSQLAGYILDDIGHKVLAMTTTTNNPMQPTRQQFQMQEYANLLWAWATAGRADATTVETVLHHMIQQQRSDLEKQERQQQQAGTSSSSSTTTVAIGDGMRPQEWSNSIWALATAQIYQGHEELLDFVAYLMETYPAFCNQFKPQEMSNTVWGVATLLANKKDGLLSSREQTAALSIVRSAASYVMRQGTDRFKTQELSNTAWAMATLGFGLATTTSPSAAFDQSGSSSNSYNNYVVLESDRPQEDAASMREALEEIVQAALRILPRFRSQELNNFAWSLARLVDSNSKTPSIDAVLDGIGRQLLYPQRKVSSQDIGTSLWGLATLEHKDDDLYRRLAARLNPRQAHTYKPQELSNTLWALATAEVELHDRDAFDTTLVPESKRPASVRDAATASFAVAARELMRRPHQFKSQEIKDVLWSYSKGGIRHPALFQSVAKHLIGERDNDPAARGLDEFSPQGLGNMAWAFARQAQLADAVGERLKGACNLSNSNGRLAVYITSSADIGERLLQRLFLAIGEANLRVHSALQKGKPQDMSNTAWAFAVLGLKYEGFLAATQREATDRTSRFVRGETGHSTFFKGQELANLLWALATLKMPGGELVKGLAPYICAACQDGSGRVVATNIAKVFKRQELANMAWACAVFGEYPPELMDVLFTGLVGAGKEQNPVFMSNIHGDQGLQSQAIMTLIYVQAVLDISGSSHRVSLPENFPDGWQQLKPSRYDDSLLTDMFDDELKLSTSKMQRAVSDALLRIGFDHVEEHVITMEEMSSEHGINVSPKSNEILSIDIAIEKDKIAIEVDGPAHYICRIDQDTYSKEGYYKFINGKLEYQFMWDGDAQEVNGATSLKHKLLESLGWRVIHIPFWEWYQLAGSETAEEEYCRHLFS